MSDQKKRPKRKAVGCSVQVHIRRCHRCDGVSESDGNDVKACAHCGKSMAPFYFFKDDEVEPHSDHEPRPLRASGKVVPVLGFTAYW